MDRETLLRLQLENVNQQHVLNRQDNQPVLNGQVEQQPEDRPVQQELNLQVNNNFPNNVINFLEQDVQRNPIRMQRENDLLHNLRNDILMERRELEEIEMLMDNIQKHINSQIYNISQIYNQINSPNQNRSG
ncbi:hypothetical protein LY90DRAFT_696713 [Neocallimastix californiae]|uniref:Uncharacterized protein n=1 Tax=Neocallimastix californiae TaxID=1754190 RepID=A0A1Y2FTI6_9FUNG|nr:hypothetical protein LY90DRAFT_696713 [Neocallimastix californiae]|eukprot:ORY87330.1 hypothetical protein LY90DRAFT_696713 [Neocallimastix californiae]